MTQVNFSCFPAQTLPEIFVTQQLAEITVIIKAHVIYIKNFM